MNVSTGMRNPFTIHDMAVITTPVLPGAPARRTRTGCRSTCRSGGCRRAPRSSPRSTARPGLLEKGRNVVDRFPIPRSDEVELRLHKDQRKVDRLRRLNEIYWPYGALDCVFDDRNTRELLDALHPDDRERFSFDVDEIDWDHYLGEVHLPALRAIAVPPAAGPKKTTLARPHARAGGPARAGDLRRRGRRAGLDRRALLRLAAHARHARARQARVDRRRGDEGARLDHGGPALADRVQPQLLPALQGPAGARAAPPGARGAAGLHPAPDPARGRPPDPPAQAPRRPGDPDHRRARLPRRVAAAPRRRADRGAARGARRPLHRRAGRAAADRRRPRQRSPRASPPTTASTSPTATPTATASPTCRCSSSSATRTRSTPTSG